MDLLTGIATRASAARLTAPGPTREHLEQILRAGARAPDHGRLKPWRFIVLQGDARAKLGDAMATVLSEKFADLTPEQLAAERAKPMRAPTIVVAAARIMEGKIPAIEQVCAVSAAVQNMLLAAHALGYGAMWKTGGAAHQPAVKSAFGLSAEDQIVAFVYLGSIAAPGVAPPADIDSVTTWMS